MLLECDEEKRNSIEKIITGIHKGEVVEFIDNNKNY